MRTRATPPSMRSTVMTERVVGSSTDWPGCSGASPSPASEPGVVSTRPLCARCSSDGVLRTTTPDGSGSSVKGASGVRTSSDSQSSPPARGTRRSFVPPWSSLIVVSS